MEKSDFMVFGRECYVPAQKIPSLDGYPSRGIRTDRWLLILNLEPNRWPAEVPQKTGVITIGLPAEERVRQHRRAW